MNTVLTGEAKFIHLHEKSATEVQGALTKAGNHVNNIINTIASRLGLDHDRVFFARGAVPVMARFLEQHGGNLNQVERDKLLFWYVQAGMWGRFSGSTESYIDADLEALNRGGLDELLDKTRLWHGGLRVEPGHFSGWSLGARFYPILYMLTRMGGATDWGNGLALNAQMLGKMSSLEVHHIFPKARLYEANFGRADVNALANFCFLTKGTNLNISDKRPEIYFEEIEKQHPGALASQWIPMDRALWHIDRYQDFLAARRDLLAVEINKHLLDLLHGDDRWLSSSAPIASSAPVLGGFANDDEESELVALRDWAVEQGLAEGMLSHELVDDETGEQRAVLDLAWPAGVQQERTESVAVLLGETPELVALASAAGYRCFITPAQFRHYVEHEITGVAA